MSIKIDLPSDYDSSSFVQWDGSVYVIHGDGSNPYVHALPQPKIVTSVKAGRQGGTVRMLITVKYALIQAKPSALSMKAPIALPLESGDFRFGCQWDYHFSQGDFKFGPGKTFIGMSPDAVQTYRGDKMVQGFWQNLKQEESSGDQDRPWVYAEAFLRIGATAAENSSISFSVSKGVPGASYTPETRGATSGGGWPLGDCEVDLTVQQAPISVNTDLGIDPNQLALLITYKHEKDTALTDDAYNAIVKWVTGIRSSKLMEVLKKKYLPIHVYAHASPTGGHVQNASFSDQRRDGVVKVITAQFKEFAVDIPPGGSMGDGGFTPFPKRPKNVNTAYEMFRNVGVFIDDKEAKEALERLAIEQAKQGPKPILQETR